MIQWLPLAAVALLDDPQLPAVLAAKRPELGGKQRPEWPDESEKERLEKAKQRAKQEAIEAEDREWSTSTGVPLPPLGPQRRF